MSRSQASGARWHPSPNFGPRRRGELPALVVIHYTAMTSAEAALARLCDPGFEVSAHYLISERGGLWQLVAERDRAWHAGAGQWGPCTDVNSASIGIELAHSSAHPFPEPQMRRLESLLRALMARWRIPPQGVIGHSDMAVGRKFDPGPRFDWRRLALQGLSVWPQPAQDQDPDTAAEPAPDAAAFLEALRRFGYAAPAGTPTEEGFAQLLTTWRWRFRPHAAGPLSPEDLALARDLAARFPIDREAGLA